MLRNSLHTLEALLRGSGRQEKVSTFNSFLLNFQASLTDLRLVTKIISIHPSNSNLVHTLHWSHPTLLPIFSYFISFRILSSTYLKDLVWRLEAFHSFSANQILFLIPFNISKFTLLSRKVIYLILYHMQYKTVYLYIQIFVQAK